MDQQPITIAIIDPGVVELINGVLDQEEAQAANRTLVDRLRDVDVPRGIELRIKVRAVVLNLDQKARDRLQVAVGLQPDVSTWGVPNDVGEQLLTGQP
jgi:hypothetical protein